MNSKLSEEEKVMAYILNKKLKYNQEDIADFMAKNQPDKKVSQSTISTGIKDAQYKLAINQLQTEYLEAKRQLEELGFSLDRQNLIPSAASEMQPQLAKGIEFVEPRHWVQEINPETWSKM